MIFVKLKMPDMDNRQAIFLVGILSIIAYDFQGRRTSTGPS
jgi:hypothetical protein